MGLRQDAPGISGRSLMATEGSNPAPSSGESANFPVPRSQPRRSQHLRSLP